MKTFKKLLAAGIASAILAFPSSPSTHAQDLEYNWRSSFTPRYYSLDLNESRKVPVHPNDAGFLHGDTEVKAGSGLDFFIFDFGLEARAGEKRDGFNFFGGADLEIDLPITGISYSDGGRSDSGMFTAKQQSSDTRSESSGSFVYDGVKPDTLSFIPFVGVGSRGDDYFVDLECAFPIRGFEREWGHHRFDKEEGIGSERYDAKGNRFSLKTGPIPHNDLAISLQLMYEDYNLKESNGESAGKLKSYSIGINFTKTF